jgi:hypothetical protein
MHVFKSRFLTRGEVWFDMEPDGSRVDWIYYHQRPAPVRGASWKYFHTILIDLRQDLDVLTRKLHKSTAYKIRRAREKDRVTCEATSKVDPELFRAFADLYRKFAADKGLAALDESYLRQLADLGSLELSLARDVNGTAVVYHAYYRGRDRTCLLHSVSLHERLADSAARNAVSRANCYLFWCDAIRHREQGMRTFDFGGWYPGNTDESLLDINRFKEGFGGEVVREYDCREIRSAKGWLLLSVAACLAKARELCGRLRPVRTVAPSADHEPEPQDSGSEPNPVDARRGLKPREVAS